MRIEIDAVSDVVLHAELLAMFVGDKATGDELQSHERPIELGRGIEAVRILIAVHDAEGGRSHIEPAVHEAGLQAV